ncbi:MAG: hypothetical protein GY757_48135 [bacterium]|nr:hypothetical protein [bacterium]
MKKNISIICLAVMILSVAPLLTGSELGNQNLKGIDFLMVSCVFNGVPFYEGYIDKREEKIKEFNLDKALALLKEDHIPLSKKNIRAIYRQVNIILKEAEISILKTKAYALKKSTVIPTISVKIDVLPLAENLYFSVVHVTLSKWLSNWAAGHRYYAPVYTWSDKLMITTGVDELLADSFPSTTEGLSDIEEQAPGKTEQKEVPTNEQSGLYNEIEAAVADLMTEFISEMNEANSPTTDEEREKERK